MPPIPQFYDSTDVTLQTATITLPSTEAGATWGPTTYHLWNDKGGSTATTLRQPRIEVLVYDSGAGDWVNSGFAPQTESWIKIAATGQNNVGDSTMTDQTTGYMPVGTNNPFTFRDIPRNCARYFAVKLEPPAGANPTSYQIALNLIYEQGSVVIPLGIGLLNAGIILDRLDTGLRRVTRGRGLTASGAATVSVVKGSFAYDGVPTNVLDTTVTLNQTAADGALTVGTAYIARLSQKSDGTVTTTKSNKAVSPSKPAVPANEINLGCVTVIYQAGGTSIINSGNLDVTDVTRGEYLCEAGTGLNLTIGAGEAFASTDRKTFNTQSSSIALTDNATNYVWLRPDETKSANTTGAAPVTGAQLLAVVVTAGGAITSITDRRKFVAPPITEHVLTLAKSGAITATAADYAWESAPWDYYVSKVRLEIGQLGNKLTAGSFKADVLKRNAGAAMSGAGTTLYTSSGTSDQRPTVAYNATTLFTDSLDYEVVSGSAGDRISASIITVPTIGAGTTDPQDLVVYVHLRRK